MGYQPRRRSTGSRGIPIDPHFAQVLLQAALRIDANGQQHTYLGADRNQAVLALGLATGIRRFVILRQGRPGEGHPVPAQARDRKSFSILLTSTPSRPSSLSARHCCSPVATMA